jgi:hypothetical protein
MSKNITYNETLIGLLKYLSERDPIEHTDNYKEDYENYLRDIEIINFRHNIKPDLIYIMKNDYHENSLYRNSRYKVMKKEGDVVSVLNEDNKVDGYHLCYFKVVLPLE